MASQLLAAKDMSHRNKAIALSLAVAVAITRFLFRSHDLYDIDSVNFALGMKRFDPSVHQPHPPGYFLYICLGRLLQIVFHHANLALIILSIGASCAVVLMIYKLALEWFGQSAALWAGILFLFSPLAWFHGTVALTYIVEAFFSTLLGYLCWYIYCGRRGFILLAGVTLGISAGVRPSSLLFLIPLFLFSLRKASWKGIWTGLAALALTVAAWFLPMISASGGWKAYFYALTSLWLMVPGKSTVFNSSPATSIARACTIVFIAFLYFGAASLAPLGASFRTEPVDSRKKIFTAVWTIPALCFFVFGYLKFVNSGYLLLLSAPACLWFGLWTADWYEKAMWRRSVKMAVIGVGAAVNVFIFLASPFYCSYRSVRQFETELESIRTAIPQIGSPHDMLIVGFDSHFLGYRHAGYYLPDYLTVEYPEVKLKEGVRIFAMHDRDTHLVPSLPVASYSRFVLFPLPNNGDSYREYLEKVKARLPSRDLKTVHLNGHDFITGPISDLPLLFPVGASPVR